MIKNESIKIVVLYTEVVGYVMGMFKALLQCDIPIEIDVVFWDKKSINSSRFILEKLGAIRFHPRSSLDENAIFTLLLDKVPDIIYVSGWMDKGYLRAIHRYRNLGKKCRTVCGIDDQWEGKIRQLLGKIYYKMFYARLFDFMWVSGKPQYHFAQRFGHTHERIISNLYSADGEIFNKSATFSKRFVFIGRFDPVKALDQLVDAYLLLPELVQQEWPLVLIGDGELKEKIESNKKSNLIIMPFMQPEELKRELVKGGVACITSHHEQWGVAIHEMALLGFPMILSSACGAATEFLISGYNGFLFRRGNIGSLYNALEKITSLSDEELRLFAYRSHELGERINGKHVAYSLLSVMWLSEI